MITTVLISSLIVGLVLYNVYKAIKNVYNMVNDEETRINKQN